MKLLPNFEILKKNSVYDLNLLINFYFSSLKLIIIVLFSSILLSCLHFYFNKEYIKKRNELYTIHFEGNDFSVLSTKDVAYHKINEILGQPLNPSLIINKFYIKKLLEKHSEFLSSFKIYKPISIEEHPDTKINHANFSFSLYTNDPTLNSLLNFKKIFLSDLDDSIKYYLINKFSAIKNNTELEKISLETVIATNIEERSEVSLDQIENAVSKFLDLLRKNQINTSQLSPSDLLTSDVLFTTSANKLDKAKIALIFIDRYLDAFQNTNEVFFTINFDYSDINKNYTSLTSFIIYYIILSFILSSFLIYLIFIYFFLHRIK